MGMQLRTDAQRIAAYDAGVAPTTVSLKIAGRLANMKLSFAGATNDLVNDQLAVAQHLDGLSIVGPMRGRYHAYGNRLHFIKNHYTAGAATQMAQIEHDKWEAVCQDAILISIALACFGYIVT
jgi:hypothetical protein